MSDQQQQLLDEMRGAIVDMAAVVGVLAHHACIDSETLSSDQWRVIEDRLLGLKAHVEKINGLSNKP